jgi:hypothetical protein
VENLARTTNSYKLSNQLACLRNLTSGKLYNAQVSQTWNPPIDSDFPMAYPSSLMAQGKFGRIPLLIGANSDESCSFSASGLNSKMDIFNNLLYYRLLRYLASHGSQTPGALSDDPTNEPPYYIKNAKFSQQRTSVASSRRNYRRPCYDLGSTNDLRGNPLQAYQCSATDLTHLFGTRPPRKVLSTSSMPSSTCRISLVLLYRCKGMSLIAYLAVSSVKKVGAIARFLIGLDTQGKIHRIWS